MTCQLSPEEVRAWFELNIPNNGRTIRWAGNDAVVHSPLREDKSPSFSINCEKGSWHDLATGDKGGIVALAQRLNAVPPECFQKRREAPKQRTHEGTFIYTDEKGNPLLKIERYREPSGNKQFFQKTMVDDSWKNGGYQKITGNPNPLYRLDEIHNNPTATVYIHEGEVKVDRARKWNLPGVATCWPGGAQGIGKADFSPLHGRDVVLVPDNDGPGKEAIAKIAALLSSKVKSIKVATYPENFPHKGDICDCASPDEARAILATAKPWAGVVEGSPEEPEDDFYFIPESELQLTAPKWLVKGLLPEGALVEIFGAPGSGKTFWLLGALCSVAAGLPFAEHPVKQAPTLYFCGEGARDIKRRIAAWKKKNNVSRPIPLHVSNKPGDFCDPAFFEKIRKAVLEFRDQHGVPGAIGIDTLSRNISADINDNAAMAEFIRNIESLKRELGGGTLISWAHHSPHTAPDRSLGAIALKGAADVSYCVETKGTSAVKVTCKKMKDAEEPKPHLFEKDVIHLEDLFQEEGTDDVTSLYLRLVRVGEDLQEEKQEKLHGHQRTAYETLHQAMKMEGILSEGGEAPGVDVEAWRPYFMRKCSADKQNAKKRAFQDARNALVDKGILSVDDDVYFFVSPSDCIQAITAIKERMKKAAQEEQTEGENPKQEILFPGNPREVAPVVPVGYRQTTETTALDSVDKAVGSGSPPYTGATVLPPTDPEIEKSSLDSDSSSSNSGILKGDFDFSFFDNEEDSQEEVSASPNPVEPAASIPPETQSWYSSLPEDDREAIRSRGEKLLAFPDISPEDRERVFGQLVEVALIESRLEDVFPSEITAAVCEGDAPEEDDPGPDTEVFPGIGGNPELAGAALPSIPKEPEPLPPPEGPSPRASPPPSEGKREALYFPPSVKGLTWTLKNFYLEKNAEARRAGDGEEEARKWAEEMTLKKASSGEEIQR